MYTRCHSRPAVEMWEVRNTCTLFGVAMTDPVTAQPDISPPKQEQEDHGLDRDLTPEAAHGEKSYRGRDRLTGKRALITGGDSGIGAAVAIAFAREGATVSFAHLPSEKPDADHVANLLDDAGVQEIGRASCRESGQGTEAAA